MTCKLNDIEIGKLTLTSLFSDGAYMDGVVISWNEHRHDATIDKDHAIEIINLLKEVFKL